MKNTLKYVFQTILAIFIVALVCASQQVFLYIFENVTYNYIFPNLIFHIYTSLCFILIIVGYYFEASKDVFSTILGVVIAAFIGYNEYLYMGVYGKTDSTVQIIYIVGLVIGVIILIYNIIKHIRLGFKNQKTVVVDKASLKGNKGYTIEKVEDLSEYKSTVEKSNETDSSKPIA